MGVLESKAFANDTKLEACAVSDPAHILPGSRGPHVFKIQTALMLVGDETVDAAEFEASHYGPSTAAAVRHYKEVRSILNYAGKIDNVVGKKTIAALDRELKASEDADAVKGDEAQIRWARSQALQCISVVDHHIQWLKFAVGTGMPRDLVSAAFNNHFKLIVTPGERAAHRTHSTVFDPRTDRTFIPVIQSTFRRLAATISTDANFQPIDDAEARRERAVYADGSVMPAYTMGAGTFVRISPAFNQPTRGPFCQTAIILHEAMHLIDPLSGIDGTYHVQEWESIDPPIHGQFGKTGYDRQKPHEALHNPAAYGSFAIHLARLTDERFGAGRQAE
jgi:hypothetical protein